MDPRGVIAIDGPAASGKSTVARRVAEALGWVYVDSGALYRTVTWHVLREGLDTTSEPDVVRCWDSAAVDLRLEGGAVRCRVNGRDPGLEIRSPEINERVSAVAAMASIRGRIVDLLRGMTRFGSLVVEGRDIGTVVFPDTPYKFYLDASPEERGRRRHLEMQSLAGSAGAAVRDTENALRRRDTLDRTRKTAPLRVAEGAVLFDTTALTPEQVAARVLQTVRAG
jgi:cytidylate kinase